MTAQEQDLLRLKAWDHYVAAKNQYHACRYLMEQWGRKFERLGRKLCEHPAEVSKDEYEGIPDAASFERAITDLRDAAKDFKQAWEAARRFGFAVGEHEPNERKGDETK